MLSLSVNGMFAVNAARQSDSLMKTAERASSGKRLNRASDDAGGLGIAESMRTQVRGSQQAARNIQDGINIVRIGMEGTEGLFPVLQRLRELVIQAGNGTYGREETGVIQDEMDQLKRLVPEAFRVAHISRIKFDGTPSDRQLDLQIGADAGETMRIDYNPLRNTLVGIVAGAFGYEELYNSEYKDMAASLTFPMAPPPPSPAMQAVFPKKLVVDPNTPENIETSLNFLDESIGKLVEEVTYLGAMHNRLEHSLNEVTNYATEMSSSESRIRDADMAAEATELARKQITQDSANAMVSQGNIRPVLLLEMVQQVTGEAQANAPLGA